MNLPTCEDVFAAPKLVLLRLLWSFAEMCRAAKYLSCWRLSSDKAMLCLLISVLILYPFYSCATLCIFCVSVDFTV